MPPFPAIGSRLGAVLVACCAAGSAAADPVIAEFLASNGGSWRDGDGNRSDWVEIWNPAEEALQLAGWSLTDSPGALSQWPFPEVTLPPDGRLLVHASGRPTDDHVDAGGELHANFKISSGAGGFLALVDPGGRIVHAYEAYPEQRQDVSYGLDGNGAAGYFPEPSPGAANSTTAFLGFVADTRFSVDRGLFTEPFMVEITTTSEGALIRYTTDGSAPGIDNGSTYPGGDGIPIAATTTLRAAAFREGYVPTNIDTHTYIFPADVVVQPDLPEGFPTDWRGWDYGMDRDPADLPGIAGDTSLSPEAARTIIADSLRALPSMSIVMDVGDLFARPRGIYYNPEGRGAAWERAASMEIIHPEGLVGNFQAECGIRMQGFTSRNPDRNPKHSLRLVFREAYGSAKMRYPLFGEDGARVFDTIVLRSNAQDAWVYDSAGNRAGQFVRDQWNREAQRRMGRPAARGTWVHLYLNGLYWGVYNPTERPDASFMASYFGGTAEDYDILKNHEEVIDGTGAVYRELLGLVQKSPSNFSRGYNDFTSASAYWQLQGRDPDGSPNPALPDYIDVPNLIDYMIHNMYSAAQDWPGNNYIGRLRRDGEDGGGGTGFHFFSWDNEHGMKGSVNEDRTRPHSRDADSPTKFHHPLTDNAEYRLLFADHLHRAIVAETGVLHVDLEHPEWDPAHPERNQPAALWMQVTQDIERALIAESARWGDYRRAAPYTVHKDFANLRDRLLRDWFPRRSAILLEQFRQRGLYPEIPAPVLNRQGGNVAEGFRAFLTAQTSGILYYTLDGSDPRLPGGDVAPTAHTFDGGISKLPLLSGAAADRPSIWSYLDSGEDPAGSNWTAPVFDAGGWKTGIPKFGYGERDEATLIDYGGDPFNKHVTTYFRTEFPVPDTGRVRALAGSILHDDGAIVYLNGAEVYRANLPPGSVAFDTPANARGDEDNPVAFDLEPAALLRGTNVIAVEIHQLSGTDSDISFDFALTADIQKETADAIAITESTRIKSRLLATGGEWSALNDALFVVGEQPSAKNLVIAEVMYHPADNPDAEFIELLNTGSAPVDLTGLRLTGGIFFDFNTSRFPSLEPGRRVLVVRDHKAMEIRHGAGAGGSIAGEFQYGTALGNEGDSLRIEDRSGTVLHTLTYDDRHPWPEQADGHGASLVLTNPDSDSDLSNAGQWSASTITGGTPGYAEGTAATTYDDWRRQYQVGEPAEDSDGDGISNLLEYAAATDPTRTGPAVAMLCIRRPPGGAVEVMVTHNRHASDLILTLEFSEDLTRWGDATAHFAEPTIEATGDHVKTLRYQHLSDTDAAPGMLRLRCTLR